MPRLWQISDSLPLAFDSGSLKSMGLSILQLAPFAAPLSAMNCSTSLCMALLSVSVSAEGRLSKIRQVLIIIVIIIDNQYLPDLGQPALS